MAAELLGTVKSSRGDKHYEIRAGEDGQGYCECIGWRTHKKCRHLKAFAKRNPTTAAAYGIKPDGSTPSVASKS
jgi:hypothetical protein